MTDVGAAQAQVPSIPGFSYAPTQFGTHDELIMLVPRTPEARFRLLKTSAVECNKATDNHEQNAAFCHSVFSGMFPELLPLAKQELRDWGYSVKEVTEDTAAENLITLQSRIDYFTSLAIFGQFALIIYKDIDDQTYPRFMQSWVAAIKNKAGVVRDLVPGGGDIFLSTSTAKTIRIIVGSSRPIRIALLKIILANRDGQSQLNRVCNYLAETISWSEMGPLMSVFASLCMTRSPVLSDSRVWLEVFNLHQAYKRITEKEYPQYYFIMYRNEALSTRYRCTFVTLAEVARRYKSEQNGTVSQFAPSANSRNPLVNELLSVHRAYMTRVHGDDMPREIRNLTTFDIDEPDAEQARARLMVARCFRKMGENITRQPV
ncbi:hypothetical protein SSX86_005559 [Deinandra increscens subsp. villosa]|uniref:Uncharacterized protein n=1 Tax=Deinandra increscens subsp. villosa TaxID=3103831 RepID=A0AAP0DR95_9ASTR